MTNDQIKNHLLKAGVRNLKEYGYPDADTQNILTDTIFIAFFKTMLESNKGQSSTQIDNVIDDIIGELPVENSQLK